MRGPASTRDAARDEAAWTARIRQGDHDAFAALVKACYSGLFDYALACTRSPEAAEDVVQEVLANLWQRRRVWTPHSTARAYLFRTVRNRALNERRDRRPLSGDTLPGAELALVSGSDPEADLRFKDLLAAYHAAVAAMPERRREVFRLCRLYGLTYEEVGSLLGVSKGTIHMHMNAALKHLRERLAEHC